MKQNNPALQNYLVGGVFLSLLASLFILCFGRVPGYSSTWEWLKAAVSGKDYAAGLGALMFFGFFTVSGLLVGLLRYKWDRRKRIRSQRKRLLDGITSGSGELDKMLREYFRF